MEAFTAFSTERSRHNRLIEEFERQIKQLERNVVSSRIQNLIDHLARSVTEFREIFNDSRTRLNDAIETLRNSAEMIGLTPEILGSALTQPLIEDSTDNLILMSILDHARSRPSDSKVFLSENRRDFDDQLSSRRALEDAGIKYFARASNFLEWHKSQSESVE
jgi:hypothetical protein